MKKWIVKIIILAFGMNSLIVVPVKAEPLVSPHTGDSRLVLPVPGEMVHLSPPVNPPILKGLKVNPNNPFKFDFILDKGDVGNGLKRFRTDDANLKNESTRLIKYFLASLTVPEKDLWVNLSPYEKDRIVPDSFGLTEMGRDLLAQDYMLKQVTASLIYPEDELGKKFWKRVYKEAAKKYGNTNIPVNTFNKVWIVPSKAVVYENAKTGTAYVVESKLKVMLEEDYLSMNKNTNVGNGLKPFPTDNQLGSQIIREIVIPELTKEINEGKNFAQLRQVYNSLILATWYKKKIKDSILSKVYGDKNKTQGIEFDGARGKGQWLRGKQSQLSPYPLTLSPESIYQNYLSAFKKGVYNYIKEDVDPTTQERIPRKYFSGGATFDPAALAEAWSTTDHIDPAQLAHPGDLAMVSANLDVADQAMAVYVSKKVPLAQEYQEGRAALSELLLLPKGRSWGRYMSMINALVGKKLGILAEKDKMFMMIQPGYKYDLFTSTGRAGYEASIDSVKVMDHMFEITIKFDGEKPQLVKYQIGQFSKKITKKGDAPPIEALTMETDPGYTGLTELVTKAGILSKERLSKVLEKQGKKLKALIDEGIFLDMNEKEVMLDQESSLSWDKIKEALGKEAWEFVERSNYDWLAHKDELPNLVGMELDEVTKYRSLTFSPYAWFMYSMANLGFSREENMAGWKATIVAQDVASNYFEFKVRYEKDGQKKERTYQIGGKKRFLKGEKKMAGEERMIFDISGELGLIKVADIMTSGFDQMMELRENLDGFRLGKVMYENAYSISVDGARSEWANLDLEGENWYGQIVKSEYKENLLELIVEFTKEGQEPQQRTFQITQESKMVKGKEFLLISNVNDAEAEYLLNSSKKSLGLKWKVPEERLERDQLIQAIEGRLDLLNKIRLFLLFSKKGALSIDQELALGNVDFYIASIFKLLRVQAGVNEKDIGPMVYIKEFEWGGGKITQEQLNAYKKHLKEAYGLDGRLSEQEVENYLTYTISSDEPRLLKESTRLRLSNERIRVQQQVQEERLRFRQEQQLAKETREQLRREKQEEKERQQEEREKLKEERRVAAEQRLEAERKLADERKLAAEQRKLEKENVYQRSSLDHVNIVAAQSSDARSLIKLISRQVLDLETEVNATLQDLFGRKVGNLSSFSWPVLQTDFESNQLVVSTSRVNALIRTMTRFIAALDKELMKPNDWSKAEQAKVEKYKENWTGRSALIRKIADAADAAMLSGLDQSIKELAGRKRKSKEDWDALFVLARQKLGLKADELMGVEQMAQATGVDKQRIFSFISYAYRDKSYRELGLKDSRGDVEGKMAKVKEAVEALKAAGQSPTFRNVMNKTGITQSNLSRLLDKHQDEVLALGIIFENNGRLDNVTRRANIDKVQRMVAAHPGIRSEEFPHSLRVSLGEELLAELGVSTMLSRSENRQQYVKEGVIWILKNKPFEKPSYELLAGVLGKDGLNKEELTANALGVWNTRYHGLLFDDSLSNMRRWEFFEDWDFVEDKNNLLESQEETFFVQWQMLDRLKNTIALRFGVPLDWAGAILVRLLYEKPDSNGVQANELLPGDFQELEVFDKELTPELRSAFESLIQMRRSYVWSPFSSDVDQLVRLVNQHKGISNELKKFTAVKIVELVSEFKLGPAQGVFGTHVDDEVYGSRKRNDIQRAIKALARGVALEEDDRSDEAMAANSLSVKLDPEVKSAREALKQMLLRPADHDWSLDKDYINKELLNKSLGLTRNGMISLTMAPGYSYFLPIAGEKKYTDYLVTVSDVNVLGNLVELTLTMKKRDDVLIKKLQFGYPSQKLLHQYGKKDPLEIRKISPKLGLEAISGLVELPRDFDWLKHQNKLPNLVGMDLGDLSVNGELAIPMKNFKYPWMALGFKEKEGGWKGKIIGQNVFANRFELTVEFIHQVKGKMVKTYQIGQVQKMIKGDSGEHLGKEKPVLVVSEALGLDAVEDLVTRDSNESIKRGYDLAGFKIGKSNANGAHFFTINGFEYKWKGVGLDEEGWEGTIISSSNHYNFTELTVEFVKNEQTRVRTFQITEDKRHLENVKSNLGFKDFLHIEESPGLRGIRQIINQEKQSFSNLQGLLIGPVYPYGGVLKSLCKTLEEETGKAIDKESGWNARIVAVRQKGDRYELRIKLFNRQGESFERLFVIDPKVTVNQRFYQIPLPLVSQKKNKNELEQTREVLRQIFTRPTNHHWLEDMEMILGLKGRALGQTKKGKLQLTVDNDFVYAIPLHEGHWLDKYEVKIADIKVLDNVLDVTLEFFEPMADGEDASLRKAALVRTYQIGQVERTISSDGNSMQVLEFDSRLGLVGLSRLINRASDYHWLAHAGELPNLVGMKIGRSLANGGYSFSPMPNFEYDWRVMPASKDGYEGEIIAQKVYPNRFELTVEFKNDEEAIIKTFQIGRLRHVVKHRSDENLTQSYLEISDALGLDTLGEVLVQDPAEFKELNYNLEGLRLGKTVSRGKYYINIKGYKYEWAAVGVLEDGWDGTILYSTNHDGYIEFTVEFKKDGQTKIRTFEITSKTRLIKNKDLLEKEVLSIEVLTGVDLPREDLLNQAEALIKANKPGRLLRLLRRTAGIDSFLDVYRFSILNIELSQRLMSDEIFEIILETLKQFYLKDGRLSAGEVEGFMRRAFDGQKRDWKLRAEVLKKQKELRKDKREKDKPRLDNAERLMKDLKSQHQLNEEQVQEAWIQGRKEDVYQGLIHVIKDVVEQNLSYVYSKMYFQQSFSAGVAILLQVLGMEQDSLLPAYDASRESMSLQEYLVKRLKADIPVMVDKENRSVGAYSLSQPWGSSKGDKEPLTLEARIEAPEKERLSFNELKERLALVNTQIQERARQLNGRVVSKTQKDVMAKDLAASLKKITAISLLEKQGVEYGIYLSGRWGGWSFTSKEEPLEAVIVINKAHEELDELTVQLAQKLKGRVLSNNGTKEIEYESPQGKVKLKIVSTTFPEEAEMDSLLDIFANLVPIDENRPGVLDDIATGVFHQLGDLAFDEVFGYYLSLSERQGELLRGIETATDKAQLSKGGIDFNADKLNLETRSEGGEINFNLDQKTLEKFQNAPGFFPVILSIEPMVDLKIFLGVNAFGNQVIGSETA